MQTSTAATAAQAENDEGGSEVEAQIMVCSDDSKVINQAARQEGEEQAAAATAAQAEHDEGGNEVEAQIMVCSADSKVINQAARQEGEEQSVGNYKYRPTTTTCVETNGDNR